VPIQTRRYGRPCLGPELPRKDGLTPRDSLSPGITGGVTFADCVFKSAFGLGLERDLFQAMVVQVEDTSIQIFVGSEMHFRSDLRETFTGTVLHRIAWPR
jgi:hypothetical protein